jgi:hypothetical protein
LNPARKSYFSTSSKHQRDIRQKSDEVICSCKQRWNTPHGGKRRARRKTNKLKLFELKNSTYSQEKRFFYVYSGLKSSGRCARENLFTFKHFACGKQYKKTKQQKLENNAKNVPFYS